MARIALLHNHVGGAAGGGGGVRLMTELALTLQELGHRVTVACHDYQEGAEFADVTDRLDIRSVRRGPAGFPEGRRAMTERYWRGMAQVARLVPDDVEVVNSHEWPGLRGGLLAGRRLGVPVVWTRNDESIFERAVLPRETTLGDPRALARARNGALGIPDLLAGRSAAAVVVLSTIQARMVEAAFRRPADVVPMGPPPGFLDPPDRTQARRRLGIDDGTFLAVGASILFPHRRFEDLIEAAALVDDPRLHVLIVGSDHGDRVYADRLEELVRARGLEGRVTMPRRSVPDAELRDAYVAGDVFVYPNQLQTWGLAPLEALAAGTPAIVSSGAGVHEVLVDRPGVRIVPPEDPPAIADALREAMGSDWRSAVEPTREWMRTELSRERYAERMLEIFERVTGGLGHNRRDSGGLEVGVSKRKGLAERAGGASRGALPVGRAWWDVHARLPFALRSGRPLVAGPWLSEVGFELLYWIPMLRWFVERHGIDPARVTAISRGGSKPWYAGIADGYVDAFDLVGPDAVARAREERAARTGGQKQFDMDGFEAGLVEATGLDDPVVLHPRSMYNLFLWTWGERPRFTLVSPHTTYRSLAPARGGSLDLPAEYVAVKAYFSECFPDTPENRGFVSDLLRRLERSTDVVLLAAPVSVDEHTDYRADGGSRVIDAGPLMQARDNLAVQTEIVAGARRLLCTYGGFSYLGPMLGVPTVAFYSDPSFNPLHLEVMRELAPGASRLRVLSTDEVAREEVTVA